MKSSKLTAAVIAGLAGITILTVAGCSSDPEPVAPPVVSAPATPETQAPVTETPMAPSESTDASVPATPEESTDASASASDDMLNPVATPILVELDAITDPAAVIDPIDASVGQAVVFNTMTPDKWIVAATPEGVVELHQGGADGEAVLNPGVLGLAPGSAVVTVTNVDDETKVYTFSVTVK